jgi:transcription termination factor Rho
MVRGRMAAASNQIHLAELHERAAREGVSGYRKMSREQLLATLEIEPDEVVVEATVLAPDEERPVEVGPEGPKEAEEEAEELPTEPARGVLEITRQRYGFLRLDGLVAGDGDIYVSAAQVRRCELRPGDEVEGPAREPRRGERHRALVHVDLVNGQPLAAEEARPDFDALAPELPERRILLDTPGADLLVRTVDLLAPLALGQRVLIRAAPRSGRTTLLRALARAAVADEQARAIVLLIDERPEEGPGWRDALPLAEFAIATADLAPTEQVRIAELATERARRLAEIGENVVFVCDSLSRLAHAAGGVDEVKRLFGTGRNLAGGGSVTVLATTLAGGSDEGVADGAVITTESALITLDPELASAGIEPPIVATQCRVSNEEDLRAPQELESVRRLRTMLAELDPAAAANMLRERLEGSKTNPELLLSL